MASAKIFRINYKSDFILTLESDAGWMTPFCIKFWTGAPSQAYYVGWDGETYNHCSFDPSEPTKLQVQFDDHHLPIGDLKYQVAYHFTVADFPNDTEDEVINPANITTEIDGETYQVMLDFTGETAPEIQFALPAYANEAQRIANEQQRIAAETQRIANEETRIANEQTRINHEQTRQQNEQQRINQEQARVNEYATLKADAVAATGAANDAATLAQQKAEYAQQQGGYAKDQGDYAKNQGDYAKEQGDTALADHQRAEADHGIAANDHTQAGNDHTRAESDHGIAADDHTQAGNDHTRAESDHTRAESDHAAVEVYVDSLGAFDISSYHATGGVLAKYADLTAALGTNGANIPEALRKGGMSVKFVHSSDNKYVQFRLISDEWSIDINDWQNESIYDAISNIYGEEVLDLSDFQTIDGAYNRDSNRWERHLSQFGFYSKVVPVIGGSLCKILPQQGEKTNFGVLKELPVNGSMIVLATGQVWENIVTDVKEFIIPNDGKYLIVTYNETEGTSYIPLPNVAYAEKDSFNRVKKDFEDLSDRVTRIESISEDIDFSEYTAVDGVINSENDTWYFGTYHPKSIFVPIGDAYSVVVTPSANNTSMIAFLTNDDTPVQGQSVSKASNDYLHSYAAGASTDILQVPDGTKYVCIYEGSDAGNKLPDEVNFIRSAYYYEKKAGEKLEERVNKIREDVDSFNITTYGLYDGVYDCSDEIQEALDNGGNIYLRGNGTAFCKKSLVIKKSNTHIYMDNGFTLKLADNVNNPLIITNSASYHYKDILYGVNTKVELTDITIDGGTLDFNGKNQVSTDSRYMPCVGICLCDTKRLRISNCRLKNPRRYGALFCNSEDFLLTNLYLDFHEMMDFPPGLWANNTDGLHFHGQTVNGIIENIQGTGKDDFIALNTGGDYTSASSAREDFQGIAKNIYIRNITCYDGTMRAVRLLTGGGYEMDNIVIDGISGHFFYGVIGITRWSSTDANFGRISISNINASTENRMVTQTPIICAGKDPTTTQPNCSAYIKDLHLSNIQMFIKSGAKNPLLIVDTNTTVDKLEIDNVSVSVNDESDLTSYTLINSMTSGQINKLVINNMIVGSSPTSNKINKILKVYANIVLLCNIIADATEFGDFGVDSIVRTSNVLLNGNDFQRVGA